MAHGLYLGCWDTPEWGLEDKGLTVSREWLYTLTQPAQGPGMVRDLLLKEGKACTGKSSQKQHPGRDMKSEAKWEGSSVQASLLVLGYRRI